MDKAIHNKLKSAASKIRRKSLDVALAVSPKATHFGGAFSSIDILVTLYYEIMKYDVNNPEWQLRDRFFLSKGHSILGYYSILSDLGYFSDDVLHTYGENLTELPGHPVRNKSLGIEFTNGSLGMGLAVAIGHSIAAKRRNLKYHTYVLMGDGECNEGSVWEAAMAAPHFELNNLTAIIDNNGLQQTGTNNEISRVENFVKRFESFGWEAVEIDGHNYEELYNALTNKESNKPKIIIAKTVKGKGLSFTEGNNAWHHGVMTKDLYNLALEELKLNND
jgi:transketolase